MTKADGVQCSDWEKSQNIADGARWSKYVWNIFFIVFSVVHFSLYYQIYLIHIWKTFNIGALQTDKTFKHPWTMNWILNEMWEGNSGETLCAVAFGTVLAALAALAEISCYIAMSYVYWASIKTKKNK